jgi:gamma-D-glutamyl-L-lysine dipeptidyl-peptidase
MWITALRLMRGEMTSMSETAWKAWLVGIAFVGFSSATMPDAEQAVLAESRKSAEQLFYERIIAKVEPGLVGSPDRIPLYVQLFERELINDTRLFPCRVEAKATDNGRVLLTGLVAFDENRSALLKLFRYLGFQQIDDRVEVLPSEALGQKRFGLIRTTHSFSFDRPGEGRETLTDCLLGTPIFLLKEVADGSFLCHSVEGYVGCVDGQDIHRVDAEELMRFQSGGQVRMRRDHPTGDGLVLPIGARLKLVRRKPGQIVAALPGGGEVSVPVESCHVDDGEANPQIERIIKAAERLLGTPYVWGGNTSDGIDCSGLVQTAFATEGIVLARDSNQQVLAGRLVATRWQRDGLRRGDTLYFLGEHGKIRHTGIYLGNKRYIEAVRPVVRYSSFDPASAEYGKRGDARLCFGKRVVE